VDLAGQFERDGWVRLPERIPAERTAAVVDSLSRAWRGAPHEKWANAWRAHRAVAELAADPTVLAALTELFDRRPIPFQTLDLRTGSQQRLHADAVHFDSVPAGWMCGVWVALEDVGADQGPLELVTGSHRIGALRPDQLVGDPDAFDYAAYEDRVAEAVAGRPVEQFLCRRGDVVVWHADLVHGGAPVLRPGATRWSQVTHYVLEGAAYITPMRSDLAAGEYSMRHPLVDLSTGRRVRHLLDGEPLRMEHLPGGRTRLWPRSGSGPGPVTRARSATRGALREVRSAVAAARDARRS
jgi:hypothetical protein